MIDRLVRPMFQIINRFFPVMDSLPTYFAFEMIKQTVLELIFQIKVIIFMLNMTFCLCLYLFNVALIILCAFLLEFCSELLTVIQGIDVVIYVTLNFFHYLLLLPIFLYTFYFGEKKSPLSNVFHLFLVYLLG